eukprot:6939582-Prymnesium_polylepis.1
MQTRPFRTQGLTHILRETDGVKQGGLDQHELLAPLSPPALCSPRARCAHPPPRMESALVVSGGVVHEPSNDVPVTSGVIAQWEAHEAYARSVLEVPTDDPGPVARQPRSWDPWGGQAPAGWVPWDASFRERLGILGETIQLQQENLAAARERWGQVYGNGYAAGTSAYSSEQVAAQASKVDSLHGQLRAVASLPGKPANELDRAL